MVDQLTTCLWFDTEAEDAARFYAEVFPDTTVGEVSRYPDDGSPLANRVMTAAFTIRGQRFVALNGGPGRPHTEAVSFQIPCRDQAEVDYYWEALTAGGEPGRCAWLRDRFGVSWQVVPEALPRLLSDPDPVRARAVAQALQGMDKIVVADLEAAADGA